MKLENQVASLELCKKLKELGVKQESLHAYYFNAGKYSGAIVDMTMYSDADDDFKKHKLVSAFTVAELGEMLSWNCTTNKIGNPAMEKDGWRFVCYFEHPTGYYNKAYAITEADARAKMLIYLLENKLLTPPQD